MKPIVAGTITAAVCAVAFTAVHWVTGYVFHIFNSRHEFSLLESSIYGVLAGILVFVLLLFSGRGKNRGKGRN